MKHRTWMLTGLLVLAALVTLAGPVAGSNSAQAQGVMSRVRFLHAVPGAPEVDIYFDGAPVARGVAFGSATPHISVPGGEHQVALRQAGTGADSPVLIEVPVPLVADLAFTVVVQGTPAAIEAALYEDILDELEPGMARLTAINAIADAPALDMLTREGGPLLQGVNYGAQFGTINYNTGVQDLVMVPAGGAVDSAVVTLGAVSLQSGTLYTFVALGTLEDTVPAAGLVLATPVNGSANAVRVRVAHGSPDAPAVDVYADDVLIAPALALGEMTGHMPLPAGDYTLALRPAGTPVADTAVVTADVTLDPATPAVTVAALGMLGDESLMLASFTDEVEGVASDMARLSVINAAEGSRATVNVVDADQTALAGDLPVGQQSTETDIAIGEYMLTVRLPDLANPVDLVVPPQDYFGGVYYSVLVYGGTADVPFDARVAATPLSVDVTSLLAPTPPPAVAEAPLPAEEDAPADNPPADNPADAPAADAEASSEIVMDDAPAEAPPTEAPPPVEEAPPPAESEVVAAAPAEAAPPPAAPPVQQPTQDPNQVTATVQLDPGANLQCREYPRADARSLGLIPSGTSLVVIGRTGEPLVPETGDPTPEPTPVVEAVSDLWVSVRWDQAGGGYIRCWTAAQYLLISYRGKFLVEIEDLLEELPEEPFNRPGEAVGATEQPPTPVFNAVLATVNLDPGVSLQLRRYPDPSAEVLERVPAEAQMEVLAYVEAPSEGLVGQPTNPYWLRVRYRTEFGAATIGYVSAQYVVLTYFDRFLDLEDLPEYEVFEIELAEAEAGFYEAAGSPPTPPIELQDVVGVVNLNPGANLNLRDRPAADAFVVVGIPSGESMVINGRNGDGAWVQVTYESETGAVEGWVASQYLIVTRGGQPYAISDLPILTEEADAME